MVQETAGALGGGDGKVADSEAAGSAPGPPLPTAGDAELRRQTHHVIRKVTTDIEQSLHFNTAVAALMEFSNFLASYLESRPRERWDAPGVGGALKVLVHLLHPFAPHITEELWRDLGGSRSLLLEDWPRWDESALARDEITLVITVNGRVRSKVTVPAGATEPEIRAAALAEPRLVQVLDGRRPRKVIVVPGRLVNIVV
jgi:leucyl-tRNA synthetase